MSVVSLCAATACFVGLAWPVNALAGLVLHAALACRRRRRRRSRPDDRHAPRRPASWSTASATISATPSCISPSPSSPTMSGAAWAWILAVAAGASHIMQTNHAETQRRLYLWRRLWRALAAQRPGRQRTCVFERDNWFTRYFGFWAVGYLWLSERMARAANPIDEALAARRGRSGARRSGSAPSSAATYAPDHSSCRNCSAPIPRPS